nr:LytR C-terminal domain-containing protein [Actinomyces wuliandei]
MQRRQTTAIGTVLSIMAGLVVIGLMVWTGLIPLSGPAFSRDEATEAYTPPPCPPADSTTVDLTGLTINVYNGSETVGLAGTVETVLTDAGLTVDTADDWPEDYRGNVQIMVSQAGLVNGYSLAQIFPDSTVQIDTSLDPSDETVSVVLGAEYAHTVLTADEIALVGSGQTIVPPSGCVAASEASAEATAS